MMVWLKLTRASGLWTIVSNTMAALAVAIYADGLGLDRLGEYVLLQDPMRLLWVPLGSILLYLGGMLWNDLADVERDRALHPERPLVSGRIPLGQAWLVGCGLWLGALLAGSMMGSRGFHAAAMVLTLAMTYNLVTKHVPWLGSLNMALVRAAHALWVLLLIGNEHFDRCLAGLVHLVVPDALPWAGTSAVYPLILGGYIFGLTAISELESRRGRRIELIAAAILILVPVLLAFREVLISHWVSSLRLEGRMTLAVAALLPILAVGGWLIWKLMRPTWKALLTGSRSDVPPAVIAGLGGMILLDCLVAAAYHPLMGLGVLFIYPLYRFTSTLIRMA